MCCVTSSRRAKQQDGRKSDEVTAVVLPLTFFFLFCDPASSCRLLLGQFQGQDAGVVAVKVLVSMQNAHQACKHARK